MLVVNEIMKQIALLVFGLFSLLACQAQQKKQNDMLYQVDDKKTYNVLTEQERRVLVDKATDYPYTGDYYLKKDQGIYICRMCNNPLYRSEDKFDSHCGWPSFDQEITGHVRRVPDSDGRRIEIICMNCNGHLGHVFIGEGFTPKDTRHCVNTSSLIFVPAEQVGNLPSVIR